MAFKKLYIKKQLRKLFFFLALLCVGNSGFSQRDSTRKKDSVNAELLQQYNNKLAEIETQRKLDSVTNAQLKAQLYSLKLADSAKKEELQAQLSQLNSQAQERIAEKKKKIDSLRLTAESYPVIGFFNDTLFYIYNRLGSFSAEDRAAAITQRIKKLSEKFPFHPDSLKVFPVETVHDIAYEENIIMSISENDAIWNNTSREELAKHYAAVIGEAVHRYKSETSFKTLAKEIGLALLVLLVLVIIIRYTSRFFRWLAIQIQRQKNKRLKGININNYTLFDAEREVRFFLFINKLFKWLVIVLLIYITLPIIFGFFPWTKGLADTLISYVLNPLKKIAFSIWNYLPNLFTIIVIVFVFRYVIKGLHYLKNEVASGALHIPGFYPDWAKPTFQIVQVLIYAFMLVVIFPYMPGSDSPVFKGVSVFIGVLFTFGSAGALSNVVSGLVLTYMRAFKVGDRIKIGEVTGDIIEKSLLVTRVRTIKNEIISIPNSNVLSSHTVNYSSEAQDGGLIMHTTITIGYDVPWKKVYDAMLKAADRTGFLLKEPAPYVLQTSLDDYYVSYQLNVYTSEPNLQAKIYSRLHENIQDCCNEAGIEIMSPRYTAARDGNQSTIPADYLPPDYKAPGFNISLPGEGK